MIDLDVFFDSDRLEKSALCDLRPGSHSAIHRNDETWHAAIAIAGAYM
jgi:hypothetical protein